MNFDLTEDQEMMRDMFARFLDEHSSIARVRAAEANGGFDAELWKGLAEQGALSIRVPEAAGGLGMGVFDAAVLMEEAGRTLASGPLAEALVALRIGTMLSGDAFPWAKALEGELVVSLALHDIADRPKQWIAGGTAADAVVARRGADVVVVAVPENARPKQATLAGNALGEIDLGALDATVLASGADAVAVFDAGVEEWKLLIAAALGGLGRQALKLASEYACERIQFGQPIGQFQAISHPLADCLCEVDGGKLFVWKTIRDLADGAPDAGANISAALWQASHAASLTVAQSLQTFGGYGLTTEYDIYLYNLRAKALPLVWGDPQDLLEEAGRRRYGGESPSLPEAGETPIEFEIGEEAEAMMAEIDAFMTANVTPEMKKKFHYSWEGWVPELHKKLAEAGLLFLSSPELGGRGVGAYAKAAARRAFDKHGYRNPGAGVAEMVGLMISRAGSEELKQQVLSRIMAGDAIASLGYSEPGSGSDVFAAQCKATPEGNGWRIDGTKMFTSGANLSDYVLMLCRTNSEVPKHKGLTMFIVPLKAEGVTIQPVYTFQDERTNITFYDNVRIPDSWRLGEVDGGVRTMSVALELEHGGGFDGPMHENAEAAEELCRELGLMDKPQALARLARARLNADIGFLLGSRATWAGVNKKPNMAYGPMAKMHSSEKFLEDARDLLDLTAPLSLSKRAGAAALVNQSYRHSHGTRIYGGTSQVHRSMIAERGLGLPRTRQ
jgi:alkylation response protein AidB-like acyl-CoA dehydrogenase